jgi:hypothetical protein
VWAYAQGIYVQNRLLLVPGGRLPVPVPKAGRLFLVFPQTATVAAGKTRGAGLYAPGTGTGSGG